MFYSKLYRHNNYLIRTTGFPQLSFGHLCLDYNMTLQLAKREGSLVYFIPPEKKQIHNGIFELICNDVFILKDNQLPLKAMFTEIEMGEESWPYYKRTLIKEPLSIDFPPYHVEIFEKILFKQMGISRDDKIVTIHVREPYWYAFIEHDCAVHDTHQYPTNANIRNYAKTIEFLVSNGYKVIRIGKNPATSIEGSGVIDLATSPLRSDLFELYCIKRSEFLIASESGIRQAAELLGVPFVTINAIDLFACYPVHKKCLYLLKTIVDKNTRTVLSLNDLLSERYHDFYRDTNKWEYIENTEDEILYTVREMIDMIDNRYEITEEQKLYKSRLIEGCEKLWDRHYVKKWGVDNGYIGDGWIAKTCLEKFL